MKTMPDSMLQEDTLKNGQLNLFFRSWHPAAAARGVVIVPGFNSHSGYYSSTIGSTTSIRKP